MKRIKMRISYRTLALIAIILFGLVPFPLHARSGSQLNKKKTAAKTSSRTRAKRRSSRAIKRKRRKKLKLRKSTRNRRNKHRASRRPRFGHLDLRSGTDGAELYINGEVAGALPLGEPLKLAPGKHTIKLTKPGYTEYIDVVKIRRGKTTRLEIELFPVAGVLEVTTAVKGARVYIDGSFIGSTPIQADIMPGARALRVHRAGFHDIVRTVKAIAGSSQKVALTLQPLPIGTSPYRPAPPAPPKWYQHWYVWAGIAGGAVLVATAIIVPVALSSGDPLDGFTRFRASDP